jgi:hypothetical protein
MALTGSPSGRGISTAGRSQGLVAGYPSAAALVVLLMLGCYIVLKPYYLLPSGLPQPADMFLAAALPFALLLPQPPQSEDARGFQLFMMLFCSYAAMVSLGWSFALMDPRVARYAAQYAFNLCLLFICLRIGSLHPAATFRVLAYAISLSAIIQAASIALAYDAARLRQIASFNNPNQLGYWSVLSLCIFWMVAREAKIKWYIQAPTATCLIYTTLSSLSKASMTAVALLCMLHFLKRPKLLCIGLLALATGYLALENSTLLDRVSGRLQNIGEQQDDNLQSRGYIRIVNYPEYVVVGAGESALYRFGEVDDGEQQHEIHSTLGTILFSYGLIGSAAFAAAIWRLYRLSGTGRFLYLLPPFVYGLTHQGLRFSFLWLFFAVIAVLGATSVRDKASTSASKSTAAPRR